MTVVFFARLRRFKQNDKLKFEMKKAAARGAAAAFLHQCGNKGGKTVIQTLVGLFVFPKCAGLLAHTAEKFPDVAVQQGLIAESFQHRHS